MRALFGPIAIAFGALAIRGLAPVAAWGGPPTLLSLTLIAFTACVFAAWRQRNAGTTRALRDPIVFLLLAHFPLFASSYFWLGANHGVDAINHLEYIRSMVFDHDLDIGNDDAILGGALGDNPEPDPTQINMHGIGPAFVWAPLYLTAHSLCRVIGQACNGASRPYLAACTLTSLFLGTWGLVFAYRLALRFASRGAAFLGTLGIAWGTFLFWYLTSEPTMSHNLSFATAALTLLLIQRRPRGAKAWFIVGLSIGYSATVRFANALLGSAAIPRLLWPEGETFNTRDIVKNAVALAAGATLAFLPQMYAWQQIFGSPLLVPNGPGFLDHAPAYLGILFSPRGGLFNWSPLLYLAVPGLLAFRKLGWRTAASFWVLILLLYLTNARVPDWWGGSSFGNRRFCTVLAPMAVGLAIFADGLADFLHRRPLSGPVFLVASVSLWNLLLVAGHREHAWEWNEAASFPQMGRVAVDEIGRTIGSPFSLPGAVIDSLRLGQSLADYDSAIFKKTFSTFVLRLGDDDIPFLGGGFTAPQGTGGDLHRSTTDGSIVFRLQRSTDYALSISGRNVRAEALRVELNSVAVGTCSLTTAVDVCEKEVAAGLVAVGENTIRLVVESQPGLPLQPAEIHALSMKPRPISHDR